MPFSIRHRPTTFRSTGLRQPAVGALVRCRASRRQLFSSISIVAAQGGSRESWDFGRFVKTVLFFNRPPSIQSIAKSITSAISPQEESISKQQASRDGWTLVTGATGGVGSRVVARLLQQGRKVRALVRDPGKAKQLLDNLPRTAGAELEIVTGDISQRQTLQPGYFKGVSAVVSATAATVTPKEGDTPDRQKYKQGIKFYDPEVVGQTPEAIEFRGIQALLDAVKPSLESGDGITIFCPDQECPASEWGPLDDVVMGGTSQSSFARMQTDSTAVFRGRVSSANNGGFASVRTRNFEPPLDLSSCEALRLRVKGDGLRYKVTIRTDTFWDGVGYTQSFDTTAGEWQDKDLPFKDFVPVFRAKTKPDAEPFKPANVVSIQLMLSKFEYDGQLNPAFSVGDFSLPIANISAVGSSRARPAAARFVHISSAGVTRPNRPGIDLEKEPPAVRMNDELGGLLTWKLAGEDAIRDSKVPFAIVRPVALTEEPAGAELEIAQGDDIKGKISREDIADLCLALLEEPSAMNTTFEIKSTVPFSQPFTVDPANPPAKRDWAALLRAANLQPGVTGKSEDSERIKEKERRENEAMTSAAI